MARSIAGQAELAADKLEALLRDRSRAAPADRETDAWPLEATADAVAEHKSRAAPQQLPHTDWLFHRLTVTGPAATVMALRAAASGTGTIPWQLDLDSLAEDWFHLLVNPAHRELSLAGARMLAGQLREAVQRRHAVAVARVGHSHACPLDLHALVPVPVAVLLLGPDHPDALAWLWQHWGTTQALRHVAPDTAPTRTPPPRLAAGEDRLQLSFWSADWTPWRAFERIRADWPALRFDLQPHYDAG